MRNNRLANELWNIKRKEVFSIIALVRLHGWITKDSNRNAVQRGGPLLEWEKHRDGWYVPASVLPSLFHPLPTAMGFRNSEIKVDGREGLLQRVKPLLLMSPVFNNHTVEWFYAYFICISLNRVSEGHSEPGEVQSWGEREGKKVPMMLIFKRGLVPWSVFYFF